MDLIVSVAPHLTVVVTDTIAQSRPTSLVSGGRAFWVASIAQAERDKRPLGKSCKKGLGSVDS